MITTGVFRAHVGFEKGVIRRTETYHRLICLMLLVVSGNPAAWYFPPVVTVLLPLAVLSFVAFVQGVSLRSKDIAILSIFAFVFTIHLYMFGTITIASSASFFLKLLTALLAIRLIPDFPRHLVAVMATLAAISLLFMLPTLLGVDMASLVQSVAIPFKQNGIQPIMSIGVHSYRVEVNGGNRNCGMFWEPGAFAGYLVFSLLFLIKQSGRRARIAFLLLSLALLSTQSTTGYAAFALVLAATLWNLGTNAAPSLRIVLRGLLVLLLPACLVLGYSQLPFLGKKILQDSSIAESGQGAWQLTRVGNAISDYSDIIRRPLFGWSLSNKTRNGLDDEILSRQGNGFSGATVRLGVPVMLLYLFLTFTSFRKAYGNSALAIVALVTVVILLNGEQFLQYPLLMTVMFLSPSRSLSRIRATSLPRSRSYMLATKP